MIIEIPELSREEDLFLEHIVKVTGAEQFVEPTVRNKYSVALCQAIFHVFPAVPHKTEIEIDPYLISMLFGILRERYFKHQAEGLYHGDKLIKRLRRKTPSYVKKLKISKELYEPLRLFMGILVKAVWQNKQHLGDDGHVYLNQLPLPEWFVGWSLGLQENIGGKLSLSRFLFEHP